MSEHNETESRVLRPSQWPDGAAEDGRLYSLEVSRNMRALMADNDTSAENFELDADGMIQFVAVDDDRAQPENYKMEGVYAAVSLRATQLNARQAQWGAPAFSFYPAPIEMLAA